MSAENPTVRERVVQAFGREAELRAQLRELQDALRTAKEAEDAIRKDASTEEALRQLQDTFDKEMARAQETYQTQAKAAELPFLKAGAKYQAAMEELKGAFQKRTDELASELQAARKRLQDEATLQQAEAQASVHRAQAAVASHQTLIGQHRENVKASLGINLEALKE